jgi:hypothetical protein
LIGVWHLQGLLPWCCTYYKSAQPEGLPCCSAWHWQALGPHPPSFPGLRSVPGMMPGTAYAAPKRSLKSGLAPGEGRGGSLLSRLKQQGLNSRSHIPAAALQWDLWPSPPCMCVHCQLPLCCKLLLSAFKWVCSVTGFASDPHSRPAAGAAAGAKGLKIEKQATRASWRSTPAPEPPRASAPQTPSYSPAPQAAPASSER